MQLKSVQFRLLFTLLCLLSTSMFLLGIVLSIFSYQTSIRYEINQCKILINVLVDKIQSVKDLSALQTQSSIPISSFLPNQLGRVVLLDPQAKERSVVTTDRMENIVHKLAVQAVKKNEPQVSYPGILPILFTNRPTLFLISNVSKDEHNKSLAIGLLRPLNKLRRQIKRQVHIVIIYSAINLLVLGSIGFFRIRRMVVQPLNRLVSLAEQYNEHEYTLFTYESRCGEFGQLAKSLNGMLTKINNDQLLLRHSVKELEDANKKLKNQQQKMIQAEKLASLGRMAAGLAHEIGNPLGVVQGYLGLIGRDDGIAVNTRGYIDRCENEINRVTKLIHQLLDFSRTTELEQEMIGLHALLNSILNVLQVQPDFRDIKIQYSFEAEQDLVWADSDKLRQVFFNCLLNSADAIKASPRHDKGVIHVNSMNLYVSSEGQPVESIQVRVQDNGIGITEEDYKNIFEPFYTTKEPGKGTGLGLSVSLTIVQAFGGILECERRQDEGCTFVVTFPLASMTIGYHSQESQS